MVAQLLSQAGPIRLDAPIDDIPDRQLAASAVSHFATKLGVAAPSGVVFELPARVPVLVLHTAALVAVLRSMTSPPGSLRVALDATIARLGGRIADLTAAMPAGWGVEPDGTTGPVPGPARTPRY